MTDTDKFESFMREHQNMVYSTAMRLLGNESDAADISQEAFLKAFAHFGDLAGNDRRSGWLKTVTRNLCLNHLARYRNRWRFFSEMSTGDEDEGGGDFAANQPAAETPGHDADAARWQQQTLELALQKLPAAQRVPLVLYHFEEMSYDDIARQLQVSVGKVKTDIHRGREALRRKLKLSAEGELTPRCGPPAASSPSSNRTLMGGILL